METKTCLPPERGGCGRELPVTEFGVEKGARLRPRCKECHRGWSRMTNTQRAAFRQPTTPQHRGYSIVKDSGDCYRVRLRGEEVVARVKSVDAAKAVIDGIVKNLSHGAAFFLNPVTRCDRQYHEIGRQLGCG